MESQLPTCGVVVNALEFLDAGQNSQAAGICSRPTQHRIERAGTL